MELPITDRASAGRALGEALSAYAGRDDVLVLALPRGGLPVAYEVARRLEAPLDVTIIRKLGTPGQGELAMGAIAPGGVQVLNENVISGLAIDDATIDAVARREHAELERRLRIYRGDRPLPAIAGRSVILVDDGIATGATVRAAITTLNRQHPACIVVAAPVAPPDTVAFLQRHADEVVCLATPEPFLGVARWYRSFSQLRDEEVGSYLARAWEE